MKKNIALYILLIFLIVVNAFFLYNYLGKSNHKPGKKEQGNFIVKELQFDEAQKQKFEALDAAHHERMRHIFESEKALKDDLFGRMLSETINESQLDSISSQIGNLAKEKELEVYQHFNSIQGICNEKQKDKFEHILRQALHGKGPNGHGPTPPDRRRDGSPPRH